MNKATVFAFLLLLHTAITGCGTTPSEKTGAEPPKPTAKGIVTVFAAASTTNALNEIKVAFNKSTGAEVQANYAASSTLAEQIVNGAEADLFISADVKWADHVEGKMPVAKRRDLLGNRLVIVVPLDSNFKLSKPEDLLADEVKHLALGDPDAVPVGRYAKQALTKLGIWEKLKGKIVPAEDVRQALTYVETGAAEAGIVYATDAAISKKAKVVVEIPANLTEPVRYPVLLLRRGAGNKAAEAFYDDLDSPEATKVFERFGFVVLTDSGNGKK
jgi:molybdate transport system substrate-binding protein